MQVRLQCTYNIIIRRSHIIAILLQYLYTIQYIGIYYIICIWVSNDLRCCSTRPELRSVYYVIICIIALVVNHFIFFFISHFTPFVFVLYLLKGKCQVPARESKARFRPCHCIVRARILYCCCCCCSNIVANQNRLEVAIKLC